MKLKFITACALLLLPIGAVPAFAECVYLTSGLDQKMGVYRIFRQANEQMETELRASETDCKKQGDEITEKAAQLASAKGCEAQAETNALNKKIAKLGEECEGVFNQLKEAQTNLHNQFQIAQTDLTTGLAELDQDPNIKTYCSDEMKVAHTMADAFIALEGGIVSVKTRSTLGEGSYVKLKETGRALATRTAELNSRCGSSGEAAANDLSKTGTNAHGKGTGTPTGKSKNSQSDLTGTDKAIRDQKKSEEAIQKK